MPDEAGGLPCAADCGSEAKTLGAGACGCAAKTFGAGDFADGAASFIAETKGEANGIAAALGTSEGVDALCCDDGVNKVEMDA